jgi:hypothetical protein
MAKVLKLNTIGYATNIILMRHKSNFFIGFISKAAPQEGVRVLEK